MRPSIPRTILKNVPRTLNIPQYPTIRRDLIENKKPFFQPYISSMNREIKKPKIDSFNYKGKVSDLEWEEYNRKILKEKNEIMRQINRDLSFRYGNLMNRYQFNNKLMNELSEIKPKSTTYNINSFFNNQFSKCLEKIDLYDKELQYLEEIKNRYSTSYYNQFKEDFLKKRRRRPHYSSLNLYRDINNFDDLKRKLLEDFIKIKEDENLDFIIDEKLEELEEKLDDNLYFYFILSTRLQKNNYFI